MAEEPRPPPEAHEIDPMLPHVDYADGVDVVDIHAAVLRENLEPGEGMEPLPIWLWIAISILIGWGGWYLGSFSGGYRADSYDERIAGTFMGQEGAVGGQAAAEDPAGSSRNSASAFVSVPVLPAGHGPRSGGVYPPLVGSEM